MREELRGAESQRKQEGGVKLKQKDLSEQRSPKTGKKKKKSVLPGGNLRDVGLILRGNPSLQGR